VIDRETGNRKRKPMRVYWLVLPLTAVIFGSGCASLQTTTKEGVRFVQSQKIYVDCPVDSVNLAPDLQTALAENGFNVTDSPNLTRYNVTLAYKAYRDVFHWAFHSMNVKVTDLYSGQVIWSTHLGDSQFESARTFIRRVATKMRESLLSEDVVQTAESIERAEINVADFKKYLETNADELDEIEGIWSNFENTYKVAIKRKEGGRFIASILESEVAGWTVGEVKAEFSETAYDGMYSTKYFLAGKLKVGTTSEIDGRGMLQIPVITPAGSNFNVSFLKNYPPLSRDQSSAPAKSVAESPSKYDDYLQAVVVVRTPSGTGSGFFVSSDGILLTNEHVVGDDRTVSIKLRGGELLMGYVVATDVKRDLALITVRGKKVPWLSLAENNDADIGDSVVAIGTPLGELDWTVTKGIVSAYRENPSGVAVVQTDAALNRGNSGGPLISEKTGRVVGVNTYGFGKANIGLNFAVSAQEVKDAFSRQLSGNRK